jgi:hypothetical protein
VNWKTLSSGIWKKFLLELGGEFTFIARQKRLRVGDLRYRVDLLLFHRRLRCLILTDLKLGRFTHADAGQMNMYLNYATQYWTIEGENPPVGLILCSERNEAVALCAGQSCEQGSGKGVQADPSGGKCTCSGTRSDQAIFTEQPPYIAMVKPD